MKFGRMLALSLAAMLIAGPAAHAQDDMGDLTTKKPVKRTTEEENNDPARPGVLLGVGAIYAFENMSGLGMDVDGSGGFNAHIGYRWNRWVALDLLVERYVQFDGHAGGADVGEVNGWAVGFGGKGYLLPGRVQPWVGSAITYLDMETTNSTAVNPEKTDDGPALRFSAGVDLYTTPRLIVTTDVSYMLGFGEVDGYDMVILSLGFFYRP